MMAKNEDKWIVNYEALKAYIDEHLHLPDKHKLENRGLLSWNYQMKKNKAGIPTDEQESMLQILLISVQWSIQVGVSVQV